MILENLLSEDYAVKAMTFLLWAVNEFGPEEYGTRMEEFQEAPEGVEFPVVKEESINE